MNKKYVLSWHDNIKFTAGAKAKNDVEFFLKKDNYRVIRMGKNKYVKLLNILLLPFKCLFKKDDFILLQYPSGSEKIRNKIVKIIKKYSKMKLIILIHDLDSLRNWRGSNCKEAKEEIETLKLADGIIVQNEKMKTWLLSKSITCPIQNLKIFDYYNPNSTHEKLKFDKTISFAGNLSKSTFLENLNLSHSIDLYGPNPLQHYPSCVKYRGVFSPEILPTKLKQSFGLVWDGPSIDDCKGSYGEYLKYNDPHKVSLYLSSGIPVIIWEHAALAKFVKKNNVGIVIDSLNNLDRILNDISIEEYIKIQRSAQSVGEKIRSGYFIRNAMAELIKKL